MTITFRSEFGFILCLIGAYLEVRDGLNQSANLLGVICEAYTMEHAFRSSGQNMYLKFHGHIDLLKGNFHINYTAKPMNITGFYSFIDPFGKIISLLSTYKQNKTKTTKLISYIFFYSVTPVLSKVETKQVVLHNQTSFLWCLAEGAPAPVIAWRKNGLVVQNSTSVRYSMGIVKRSNDNYSCEVKKNEKETMKVEFVLTIESELLPQYLEQYAK